MTTRASTGKPGTDRLTGLPDEAALKARLAETGWHLSLIVVRVVDFAALNAAWGREGGNAVLRSLSDRLSTAEFGAMDSARTGGFEFAAIIPHVPCETGEATVAALLRDCAAPVDFEGHQLRFTLAAGAVTPLPGERPGATMDRARAAAAAAPAGGVAWWGEREWADDARLAIDLRRALDRNEIEMLFQPQLDRSRGSGPEAVFGVEALARWRHDSLGAVNTGRLFAVASRSDFAGHLTEHLLDRTLETAVRWSGEFANLRLGVNVSARDLARGDFVRRLGDRLFVSGVQPSRITVEITEDLAMDQPVESTRSIVALKELGCRVVLDDFGTGQSSLAWLARLPIDGIKFDRGFTASLNDDPRARTIMGALTALAFDLGCSVLAEGIETEAEAALLMQLGCTRHQGFLYAPPMASDDLIAWMTSASDLRQSS